MTGLSLPGLNKLARLADVTSTPETNLRTYVRGADGLDGLWSLTIDAGSAAVSVALRAAVGAPYHHADMSVENHGGTVTCTGSRKGVPTAGPGAPCQGGVGGDEFREHRESRHRRSEPVL